MKQYEAMFLFDSTIASDFGNVEKEVDRIMKRADAEIIVSRKWEERKLAFEIKNHKRACYVLTYFRAEPDRIVGMERDVALSESILRVLILCVDGLSRQRMEAMYPQRAAERPQPDAAHRAPPERKGDAPTAPTAPSTPDAPTAPTAPDAPATAVAVAETGDGATVPDVVEAAKPDAEGEATSATSESLAVDATDGGGDAKD